MRGPKCSRGQTCLLLSAGSTVPKVSQPPRVTAVTVFVSGVLRLICSTREFCPRRMVLKPTWKHMCNRVASSLQPCPSIEYKVRPREPPKTEAKLHYRCYWCSGSHKSVRTVIPLVTWDPDVMGGDLEGCRDPNTTILTTFTAPPNLPVCKRLHIPLTYSFNQVFIGHLLCTCPSSKPRIPQRTRYSTCPSVGGGRQ